MSAAENKAVFLSYASQDTAAVLRIAEVLRAAGIVVWFDKDELTGGDAWDAKIRKQIAHCALFVPVISANTQARGEGYFRIEWRLAAQRTHGMADDTTFLLPVVIDETRDAEARVPAEFRAVQWTRLPGGETPPAFSARVGTLLGGSARLQPASEAPERGLKPRATPEVGRRVPAAAWTITAVTALTLIAFVAWLQRDTAASSSNEGAGTRPPTPEKSTTPSPLSEARQLVAKARVLFEPLDGATRQDFQLAEDFLKRAVALDATDAEVWAAYGIFANAQVGLGHDRSPARIELARTAAERAMRLAPNSRQARFARAGSFRFQPGTGAEVERLLRELVDEGPDERLILRTYASVLRGKGNFEEAIVLFDRAAAVPGGDAAALYGKFAVLSVAQRHDEAEAVLDAAIALEPAPYLLRAKVSTLMLLRGDLDGAAAVLAKVPAAYLLEDTGAYAASLLWLWRREGDKAVSVWGAFTRDLIECAEFRGPKAFVAGQAHAIAGRPAAAQAEWSAALRTVEQQLASQPSAVQWVYWKARLLAALERRPEAEEVLKTFEQLTAAKGLTNDTIPIYLLLGRRTPVLDALEKGRAAVVALGKPALLAQHENNLRLNVEWDPLRAEPRFVALLQKPEAKK